MKSYWILFLCLSCLGAGGCSGMCQRKLSALERENSQLNGLLWEMEFEVEALQDENSDLRKRLESSEEDDGTPRPIRRSKTDRNSEPPPFDPGEFRPPVIEFPSEPTPGGSVPESLMPSPDQSRARRRSRARVAPVSAEKPAPIEPKIEIVPAQEVALDSSRIARIQLAPIIGSLHLDNKPGDDGLVIVVEPWDRSNQMLADAGDISVALLDPAEPAENARYARWEFEAEETVNFFRDGDVPGLHLELPWPGDPPRHKQLHLVVRYTTSDGRKLHTDSMVEVDLGEDGGWVATDTPRVRPYERPIALPKPTMEPPQLLVADTEPAAPMSKSAIPVRTVSLPRGDSQTSPRIDRTVAPAEPEPRRETARETVSPIREPAPEPEPAARKRPVWSPDRPW